MAEATNESKVDFSLVEFELVAPERLISCDMVDMVVAPGESGDFGVLPGHSLFMTVLRPGVLEIHQGNQVAERIFVGGGFAEVNAKSCIVLAEEAVAVRDIDVERARRRLSDARDDLGEAKDDGERARFEREIAIAEAMIEAAGS